MASETPANVEGITKEWLQHVLTESHQKPPVLQKCEVTYATKKGDNFVSILGNADMETEDGEKLSWIIKLAPEGEFHKKFFQEAPMFEKEAYMYNSLIKDLNKYQMEKYGKIMVDIPVPTCVHVKNEQDGRSVIVLENLKTEGFQMFNKKKETDYEHARVALEALAKLHAVSFAMKQDRQLSYPEVYPWTNFNWAEQVASTKDFFQNITDSLVAILEEMEDTKDYIQRLKRYKESRSVVQQYSKLTEPKEPMALITHGDYWNNNMLFKYQGGSSVPSDFRMLDLQLSRYTLGVVDVIYYVYTSTSGTFRQKYLEKILKVYHDAFFDNLKKLDISLAVNEYSFDQFVQDFNERAEMGLIMGAMIIPLIMSDPDQIPDYEKLKESDLEAYVEEWNETMRKKASIHVRNRVFHLVKDMCDRGVL